MIDSVYKVIESGKETFLIGCRNHSVVRKELEKTTGSLRPLSKTQKDFSDIVVEELHPHCGKLHPIASRNAIKYYKIQQN